MHDKTMNTLFVIMHDNRFNAQAELEKAVAAKLPKLDMEEFRRLQGQIKADVDAAMKYVYDHVTPENVGDLADKEFRVWIKARCPWMNERTITTVVSDAVYNAIK